MAGRPRTRLRLLELQHAELTARGELPTSALLEEISVLREKVSGLPPPKKGSRTTWKGRTRGLHQGRPPGLRGMSCTEIIRLSMGHPPRKIEEP